MLTVQYAHELGPKGFTVFALSPGWLQKDLGGEYADLQPADGARASVEVILNTRPDRDNGSFRDVQVKGFEERGLYTNPYPAW